MESIDQESLTWVSIAGDCGHSRAPNGESLRPKDLMPEPGRKTISQIRAEARRGVLEARVHAQIEEIARRDASNGKPFWEIRLRDAADAMTLKAWSDSANFAACKEFEPEMAVEVEGEFSLTGFDLDARRWVLRPKRRRGQRTRGRRFSARLASGRFERISQRVSDFSDPRLKVWEAFLGEFGSLPEGGSASQSSRFPGRPSATHRANDALADALALRIGLNRDLLLAGVPVQIAENFGRCARPRAFAIQRELRGELLGHISIGIEVVNALATAALNVEDLSSAQRRGPASSPTPHRFASWRVAIRLARGAEDPGGDRPSFPGQP